jgi:hypothetical protein
MNRLLRPIILAITALSASAAMADVTFFENDNFGGRQFTVGQYAPNFRDSGFNDRAQSAIVSGGSWELCVDRDFGGGCTVLAPGRYPTLGSWSSRISSARLVAQAPVAAAPIYEPRRDRPRDRASAILFSGPNMSGRQIVLGGDGNNDLSGQFNDRASSLVVERGYWIFCSDSNFRGECMTFGPGEYPTLPPELDNRISSGRRISHTYPYSRQSSAR